MENTGQPAAPRDDIRLGDAAAILRANWWKIAGLSLAAGLLTLGFMYTKPDLYRASATITPAGEDGKQNPAMGAFAALGVPVGSPSKVEDLEILFRSNDLTVRVFSRYDLWLTVLGDRFDAKTGKMKPSWNHNFLAKVEPKPPGEWDAIRTAKERLSVTVNRRSGSISLSFESPSPQGSADIVKHYLDEAKSRLQEEALDRANKNKRFIEEQIGRTVDVLSRERLYSLLGQEMEKEMMARNREQFGFRVVDAPRVPDRKSGPARSQSAIATTIVACILTCGYFLSRRKRET